jgi:hypothetical protein
MYQSWTVTLLSCSMEANSRQRGQAQDRRRDSPADGPAARMPSTSRDDASAEPGQPGTAAATARMIHDAPRDAALSPGFHRHLAGERRSEHSPRTVINFSITSIAGTIPTIFHQVVPGYVAIGGLFQLTWPRAGRYLHSERGRQRIEKPEVPSDGPQSRRFTPFDLPVLHQSGR